tara:strand:+ start:385 stop:1182 length:798 start_codon:yes stop_codon:yes gene_type:complete
MINVLVLGDCSSNGINVLAQQIIGTDKGFIEYNIAWDIKNHKSIVRWYLDSTKGKREKNSFDNIVRTAHEYLKKKEIQKAWPALLDNKFNITNLSKEGATAYGYYRRLYKYEIKHGRPDLIILTDHHPSHPWQRINIDGHKYFLEKNYDKRRPVFQVNPLLKASAEVQELAFNKAKHTTLNDLNKKRNVRIMNWFYDYLVNGKYKFIKVKFYEAFAQFNHKDVVDCSDLFNRYRVLPRGEDCKIKNEVQHDIAKRVQEKILQLTI